jgi:hypothetical protein
MLRLLPIILTESVGRQRELGCAFSFFDMMAWFPSHHDPGSIMSPSLTPSLPPTRQPTRQHSRPLSLSQPAALHRGRGATVKSFRRNGEKSARSQPEMLPAYSSHESDEIITEFRENFLRSYKAIRFEMRDASDLKRDKKYEMRNPNTDRKAKKILNKEVYELKQKICKLSSQLEGEALDSQFKVKWLWNFDECNVLPLQASAWLKSELFLARSGHLKQFEIRDMAYDLKKQCDRR